MNQILSSIQCETWVPVPNFPKYKINKLGEVRGKRGTVRAHLSKKDGRLRVYLYKDTKRHVCLFPHRLVLEAFVGPCPHGMEACHNNGNRLDNNLENLRWDTSANNQADKVLHGTSNRGRSKFLTDADVAIIRTSDESNASLARRFGMNACSICGIRKYRTWKHLP